MAPGIDRRSRFLALLLAVFLGGCSHFADRPVWHCADRIERDGLTAATVRMLDANGRQLRIRSEWLRPYALRPRIMIQGVWQGTTGDPDPARGRVRMELVVPPRERVRLALRAGASDRPSGDRRLIGQASDGQTALTVGWPTLRELLASGQPLFLVAVDGGGAVLDSHPIDAEIFSLGLAIMDETIERSRVRAADFRKRCDRHQDIILT